jgi:CDP-L-myo-inositol myo-inositolphosphotransferase
MPREWDGVISQLINRKFSRPTARLLADNTKATPNQVTVTSFLVGLASGLFFSFHPLIGGLLAQSSSILDGVDGDLAIFTGQASSFGGFMDSVLDRYADAAIFTGMIYHVLPKQGIALGIFVGFAALVGSLLTSYTRAKAKSDLGVVFKSGILGYAANRDVRLFIIMLGGIFDRVFASLAVLAVLTNFVAIARTWHLHGHSEGNL